MKFSVNYQSKHIARADEIRCPYNQLGSIYKFMLNNQDKRYNIILTNVDSKDFKKAIEQIEVVKNKVADYTIQCDSIAQLDSLISSGYNAFLSFPVSDWETFSDLIDLGVSDIYIDGPLGFSINALSLKRGKTLIRVSPTVSPNASFSSNKASSFFIRPEDIILYNNVIDIIDFKETKQEKEDALYTIYKRGTFNYDINVLVAGLPNVNNLMFTLEFAETRLNCRQRCKIPGYACHYCPTYIRIIENLVNLTQP